MDIVLELLPDGGNLNLCLTCGHVLRADTDSWEPIARTTAKQADDLSGNIYLKKLYLINNFSRRASDTRSLISTKG